jgi:hypothetical protein
MICSWVDFSENNQRESKMYLVGSNEIATFSEAVNTARLFNVTVLELSTGKVLWRPKMKPVTPFVQSK